MSPKTNRREPFNGAASPLLHENLIRCFVRNGFNFGWFSGYILDQPEDGPFTLQEDLLQPPRGLQLRQVENEAYLLEFEEPGPPGTNLWITTSKVWVDRQRLLPLRRESHLKHKRGVQSTQEHYTTVKLGNSIDALHFRVPR